MWHCEPVSHCGNLAGCRILMTTTIVSLGPRIKRRYEAGAHIVLLISSLWRTTIHRNSATFHSLYTCLNNMFYNSDNRNGNSGRAVYPSTAQPLIQKDGECIHGACKRCSDARFVIARALRHRRLWPERLRLCRFPRIVQTTLLADSAPHDDELWRFALSVVLGPRRQPQLYRLCRAYRSWLSRAARYRRRVSGV